MAKNIVYFDLETQQSADEVGGWNKISRMRMSVGVTFSTARGDYRIYGEKHVNDLLAEFTAVRLAGTSEYALRAWPWLASSAAFLLFLVDAYAREQGAPIALRRDFVGRAIALWIARTGYCGVPKVVSARSPKWAAIGVRSATVTRPSWL